MTSDLISQEGNDNTVVGVEAFGATGKLKIVGNSNTVRIGARANLRQLRVEITGDACELIIGSKCKLRGFFQIKGRGSRIIIGDQTTATGASMVALEGKTIRIGKESMLSYHIEVRTSDAHALLDLETRKRINLPADVTVMDHVWIGARVVIAKGAVVPDDVVVGQGSLVNKVYTESHCVIAGTPAKVVKRGITWDRELATGLDQTEGADVPPI